MKKIIEGTIYTFAVIGFFSVLYACITTWHLWHCPTWKAHAEWAQQNGCDYFWCPNYNGK